MCNDLKLTVPSNFSTLFCLETIDHHCENCLESNIACTDVTEFLRAFVCLSMAEIISVTTSELQQRLLQVNVTDGD